MTLLETWRARFASRPQSSWSTFNGKTDEQAAEMLKDPEELAEISDELADVIIYRLGFSDILTLDVSNAVQRKLERNPRNILPQGRTCNEILPVEMPLTGTRSLTLMRAY